MKNKLKFAFIFCLLSLFLWGSAFGALVVKGGTFTSPAGTGTDAFAHGLGVVPIAAFFWTDFTATNDTSQAHYIQAYGFTDGSSDAGISGASRDSAASGDAGRATSNAHCIYLYDWNASAWLVAAWSAWDATNITLNWTNTSARKIHFLAIGDDGTGATVEAKVGTFNADTGGGTQTVAHGMSNTPDLGFYLSALSASDVAAAAHLTLGLGFSDGANHSCNAVYSEDALATSDTARLQSTAAAISLLGVDAASDGIATTTFDATNLNVVWSTTPTAASRIHYLLLANVGAEVSSFNQKTSTGAQAVTLTSGITPKVALLASFNNVTSASVEDDNLLSFGTAIATDDRRCIAAQDEDAQGTTDAGRDSDTAAIIKLFDENSTLKAEADHVGFDVNTHNVTWDTADGMAREIIGLWIGDAPDDESKGHPAHPSHSTHPTHARER
jgi:hypothetical protein